MSGPVEVKDLPPGPGPGVSTAPVAELADSRITEVGTVEVRRALPNRGRRTVGPWCFADHFGPLDLDRHQGLDIGPHPHIGLQTVTWLFEGELVHRDSLGSEQPIRPGQLNLMTAGRGVAHAEETPRLRRGRAHGMQLWVAQPSRTRDGEPAFEHHAVLPSVELDGSVATVLVGEFARAAAPSRRDSDHVGVELSLRPGVTTVPLDPAFEYAAIVALGLVVAEGRDVGPGKLLYLGEGRDELALSTNVPTRLLVLGGSPFPEQLFMWWNFVARTREEVEAAREDWMKRSKRFGDVASGLQRVLAPPVMWRPSGG